MQGAEKTRTRLREVGLSREETGAVNISNSDIELTKHAVAMMLRRGANSNALTNTIYSPDTEVEIEDIGIGVIKYKSHEGNRDIEAICIFVQNIYSKSYKIRIITVHASEPQQIRR